MMINYKDDTKLVATLIYFLNKINNVFTQNKYRNIFIFNFY